MTVSTETSQVSYSGNGSTTVFTVTFRFLENSHLKVILRDSAGVETDWVENTQYTLTGAGDPTGTLTVKTTPTDYTPQSGETLVITRDVPKTQETDYVENDDFPAQSHEDALDKLTMMVQQLATQIGLVVQFSDTVTDSPDLTLTELAANRASKIFQFDATGATLELAAALAGSTILNNNNLGTSQTQATSQNSIKEAIETSTFDMANKTLLAALLKNPTIGDTTDATKLIAFLLSGATANKTSTIASAHTDDRTHTLPDKTGTVAHTSDVDAHGVVQQVYTQSGTGASLGSTAMVSDDSAPRWDEGNAISALDTTITPTNASNILKIDILLFLSTTSAGGARVITGLYQDPTLAADTAIFMSSNANDNATLPVAHRITHYMVAGTTSATTFKLRSGDTVPGTITINGETGSQIGGGVMYSSMEIKEIKV
jgi:hypothetical protein